MLYSRSLLVIYFIYSSVYMSSPIFQFIPPHEYHFHSDHFRTQSPLTFFKLASCSRKTRRVSFKGQILCLNDGGANLSSTDTFLQNYRSNNFGVGRNFEGQPHFWISSYSVTAKWSVTCSSARHNHQSLRQLNLRCFWCSWLASSGYSKAFVLYWAWIFLCCLYILLD